jgi:hypothetical protein
MISTLFVSINSPTVIEMATVKAYAKDAADYLERLLGGVPLESKALALQKSLYALLEEIAATAMPLPTDKSEHASGQVIKIAVRNI